MLFQQDISTPYPSTVNLVSSMDGVTLTWNDLSVYVKHKQKYFFSMTEQKTKIIKNGELLVVNNFCRYNFVFTLK